MKKYSDLLDEQLGELAAILTDTNRKKWRVKRNGPKKERYTEAYHPPTDPTYNGPTSILLSNKDFKVLFYADGSFLVEQDDNEVTPENIWHFVGVANEFGVGY